MNALDPSMREILAVLRYRHFAHVAIDLDLDDVPEVALVGKQLRAEKNRLRQLRLHLLTN